ncbi:MAG: hypothetical protein JW969_16280 [Spirochaetales bacterium]|nr:hypothetical protein [Spirochaetales bacterium]
MELLTVTQKLLAIGATYLVKKQGEQEVLNTIKGKILTLSPKLEMKRGADEGELTHILKGNFLKTLFTIEDNLGTVIATIKFPLIAVFKKFSLMIGEKAYNAQGSLTAWNFVARDKGDRELFAITKDFSLRDQFSVAVDESIPKEIIILTAIAVDQKFFQQ